MATRINQPRTRQQRRRLAAADFYRRQQQQRIREAMAGGDWTPAALFAQGQQGVWYEPKPEYLFQDSAGTIPVEADGDPVGLMLDRSRGLVLGPELVTNGDFLTDLAGWDVFNIANVAFTWEAPGLVRVSSSAGGPYQDVPVATGNYVEFAVRFRVLAGSVNLRVLEGGSFSLLIAQTGIISPGGWTERRLIGRGTAESVRIYVNTSSTGDIEISSVSVRELPGNHATQATSAARPVNSDTSPLQVYDNVDDAMNVTLPAIAAATVAIATPTGADIQYPVDLSSGSYTITESHSGIIIRDGELTAAEQQQVTAYLNAQAGV